MQHDGLVALHVGVAWMIQDDGDVSIRIISEVNAIPLFIAFGLPGEMIGDA